MPKRKPQRSKARRRQERIKQQPRAEGRPPSRTRRTIEWLLGTLTTVGTLAGLVVFFPRVTVDPDSVADPSLASQVSFTVTNAALIPLNDVQPALGLCEIRFGEIPEAVSDRCGASGSMTSRLASQRWYSSQLTMDEKTTIRLDDLLNAPGARIASASISIVVTFHPWFIPIVREKEFRFATQVGGDGKIFWRRQAVRK